MDPASLQIIMLIFLLILSSYFSMSETALTSLNKIRIRNMVDQGVKNATIIRDITKDTNKLLSAILIGNNVVNIAASAITTSLAIDIFGSSGVAIATGILTLIILIFGEIIPKTIASRNSEKIALILVKPISICITIFTPIISVLNFITNSFFKILKINLDDKKPTITESELLTMVNVSHEEGVLEIDEREMINNVVDFGNYNAKDIMVQRTDIVAINVEASYDELIQIFKNETFSRIPVFEENIDNIIGILSLKDILFIENNLNFNIRSFMREPYFTYESKPLRELFSQMRTKRMPMVIILDEYGGTAGMVTLEDMLEEIVGDISDEYDENLEEIKIITENEYVVEGSTKIEDVNEMLGTSFKSDDFDSIGGFVIGIMGRFPEKDESIEENGVKFIIEQIDKNRIEEIRILIKNRN